MTETEKEQAFREELAALYRKYELRISSCNCCGLWIESCKPDIKPDEVDRR